MILFSGGDEVLLVVKHKNGNTTEYQFDQSSIRLSAEYGSYSGYGSALSLGGPTIIELNGRLRSDPPVVTHKKGTEQDVLERLQG